MLVFSDVGQSEFCDSDKLFFVSFTLSFQVLCVLSHSWYVNILDCNAHYDISNELIFRPSWTSSFTGKVTRKLKKSAYSFFKKADFKQCGWWWSDRLLEFISATMDRYKLDRDEICTKYSNTWQRQQRVSFFHFSVYKSISIDHFHLECVTIMRQQQYN